VSVAVTDFERTTGVVADPYVASRFHADFDGSWASLRGVHGGYQTAVALRVAQLVSPDRAVRTVSTSFLRPGGVGPATLDVEVLRATRSLTTSVVTIAQDGRPVANVRVTAIAEVAGHDWATPVSDRPAPIGDCVAFTPPPQILHFHQAELLIDRATIPVSDGSPARVAGHVRPKHGGVIDAAWLVMIGDWFPPSSFRRMAIPIGGVSIDYTAHVHRTLRLADGEWLEGVFRTGDSEAGIALEHGTISTSDGVAVAEIFHTRWTG
jgi:hypothetical protein